MSGKLSCNWLIMLVPMATRPISSHVKDKNTVKIRFSDEKKKSCYFISIYIIKNDIKVFFVLYPIFFFSYFMLQVSMNNGTTFVSSDVNITAKNCTKPVYPTEPSYSRTTTEPVRSVSHILILSVAMGRVWN